MRALTSTHCFRPGYSAESLAHLRRCEGIGDWLLLPHVEPGDDEVRALIEGIDFAECAPTWNPRVYGVNVNTALALEDACGRGADFILHVEDDVLLAPDALHFFAWAAERYAQDASVWAVTGYHREPEFPGTLRWWHARRRCWFSPWGWGTWPSRWRALAAHLRLLAPLTWDCQVNQIVIDHRLAEVYPILSRAQNIGWASSIHPDEYPPEFYKEHHTLQYWAGDVVVLPRRFREVDVPQSDADWRARIVADHRQAQANDRAQEATRQRAIRTH
jgi:hypothetical protein